MLVPAILYKSEIQKAFQSYNYSDDMAYYTGYLGYGLQYIDEDNDGSRYQWAIVNNDKELIGYFSYQIDWYTSCARNFGLFSFKRNDKTLGFDVQRELRKIINDYHIHRLEWRMVGGNPVEKHYDRFCNKYHGKKFVLTDSFKDRSGNYHDDVIYEIIFDKDIKQAKWIKQSDIIFEFIVPDSVPLMQGDKVIGMVANTEDSTENISCKIFSNCVETEYTQTGEKQYSVTAIKIKENDKNE